MRILFRKAASLLPFSLVLFLACGSDPETPLSRVGGQGIADFVVAGPALAADAKLLEEQVRKHCDRKGGRFCEIMVWTDAAKAAKSFPMSDIELRAQFAQYNRNKNTGYDCFLLLRDGKVVESSRSAGCR